MSARQMSLIQGTLDMLVLKALEAGPRHGYAVSGWIRTVTNATLDVEEGALYTALHRMERRQWLKSEWGVSENNRRAKYYRLTVQGRARLEESAADWDRYARAVFNVLAADAGGSH